MAYSDFTLDRAIQEFSLRLDEDADIYGGITPVEVGRGLRESLAESIPLALAIHTEKARSEMIVAPVLIEVRRLLAHRVALFSGTEFNVDFARGLWGVCDFLITRSPSQYVLSAPVMTIVEAKRDNLNSGLGQCVASMVAAQLFNAREGHGPSEIAGAVTTGSLWRFLRLDGDEVSLDRTEFGTAQLGQIIAVLMSAVEPVHVLATALPAAR